ncbi:unnamed protein product [Owenia fusiformis]|uniref:F-box domain-containing protein n=1 Tax=Owenia fusiformis TaxID=6347 RepID=A0A8S4NMD5_OWEFU|nr:unnamed protein product [Owenia fusiformis]
MLEFLPNELLKKIFEFLQPTDFLALSKVSDRFKEVTKIIDWSIINISNTSLDEDDLKLIKEKCRDSDEFSILGTNTSFDREVVFDFDFYIFDTLTNGENITWLSLDFCPVSTLIVLRHLPNIEILSLLHCNNLVPDDITAIRHCNRIEQLYISHTGITAISLLDVLCRERFENLFCIDCQGIEFTFLEILATTQVVGKLYYFGLSLFPTLTLPMFNMHFRDRYTHIDWRLFLL